MHKHGGDVYTYENMVDFSANINPLGIPQSIVLAATKGATLSAQYPDVECRELKKSLAIAEDIKSENIACGNGAADLIFSLVLATKPKKAIMLAPTFYEYEQALRAIDCEIIYHQLTETNNFELKNDYLNILDESVDIIFICNPNNPTGLLVDKDFLAKVLEKCEKNNILFVLDECFNDFLDYPTEYSMKDFIPKSKNLFILKAFTKLYAMAGLRLGYGFSSNQELMAKIKEVTQPWNVSTPAQHCGIAALKETEYVAKARKIVKEERDYLQKSLESLGLTLYNSMANYIFFKGPENLGDKTKEHGFMIRDCSNYHGLTNGFYRIAVRDHNENTGLIAVLEKILKEC
ncbi:MAG: histidinol-phosphate transaminase [Clostridiales bacterium]